jgi:exopolysaccharide production protein ExoQ
LGAGEDKVSGYLLEAKPQLPNFGLARSAASTPPLWLVWFCTVASTTGILLTNELGTVGAALFLVSWVFIVLCYGRASVAEMTATPIIWIYTSFVVMSVLWSVAPGSTLRYGLEHVLTVAGTLLAVRFQTPRSLVSGLTLAMLLVAAASVAFGKSEVDPMTGVSSFVGLFGSKNQVGLLASLMLLCSLALLLDSRSGLFNRGLAMVAIIAVGPLLYVSKSGTSIVTAAIAVMVFLGNLLVSRFDPRLRPRILFAMFVSMLPLMALMGFAGDTAQDFIVDVMGKDTTLTGRTVLWQHALILIPQNPLGGVGAGAFWLQDTVEAESLWHMFHVIARAGFHFHDTYIEDTIELGYIGCAVLITAILSTFYVCIRWSWRSGTVMSSLFVSIMACLIIRSFVEVDLLAPFQIGTFLFFASAAYGLRPPKPEGVAE